LIKIKRRKKDMEEMNSKLVFSPMIARHLLKMGNQIIDIKGDKND